MTLSEQGSVWMMIVTWILLAVMIIVQKRRDMNRPSEDKWWDRTDDQM